MNDWIAAKEIFWGSEFLKMSLTYLVYYCYSHVTDVVNLKDSFLGKQSSSFTSPSRTEQLAAINMESTDHPKYIYKITTAPAPQPIPQIYPPSELDTKDGFLHLSTAPQVVSPLRCTWRPVLICRYILGSQDCWHVLCGRIWTLVCEDKSQWPIAPSHWMGPNWMRIPLRPFWRGRHCIRT